ncbi:transcription factor bHLH92 [Rhodamnia argentea]|uniref:Transcription factor bHLH92 n=1 Tax=Rhodamnia argentea TaxID=178133 RepID=A0A8B8PIN5_9MYRT|nr:transcription factor bHLH92 [Rhodamnia argentea]
MDLFFQEELQNDLFWHDPSVLPPPLASWSAFSPYAKSPAGLHRPPIQDRGFKPSPGNNMNKRMVEFLRRSWAEPSRTQEFERERSTRHMMNERMRRERQKHSYSALHAVLPLGTKNDKNSIVQTAYMRIKELAKYNQELERQNRELESGLNERRGDKAGGTKIRVKVANPTSGVDSMLEVLRCLNNMGLEATTIQMQCSADQLFAVIEVQNEIEAANVEQVIQWTLLEAERKLLYNNYEGKMD